VGRSRPGIRLATVLALLVLSVPASATLLVMAPHPDDAEASCGGLILNTVAAGESVIVLDMTSGELGVWQQDQAGSRAIRQAEERNACARTGARAEFFGGIDGSLPVDSVTTSQLLAVLLRLHPRVVVAPWPLDVHADHQATGLLAWRAFQDRRLDFELFFYETSNAPHTVSFAYVPTDYIDISDVIEQKRLALCEHRSQNPSDWWESYIAMARFRGYECDVLFAEGYLRARNFSGLGGRSGGAPRTLSARR
jgi:N-acetylglucosamine malate deacetylase 1